MENRLKNKSRISENPPAEILSAGGPFNPMD